VRDAAAKHLAVHFVARADAAVKVYRSVDVVERSAADPGFGAVAGPSAGSCSELAAAVVFAVAAVCFGLVAVAGPSAGSCSELAAAVVFAVAAVCFGLVAVAGPFVGSCSGLAASVVLAVVAACFGLVGPSAAPCSGSAAVVVHSGACSGFVAVAELSVAVRCSGFALDAGLAAVCPA